MDVESAVSAYRAVYDALAGIDQRLEGLERSFRALSIEVRQALYAARRDQAKDLADRAELLRMVAEVRGMIGRLGPAA